MAKKTNPNLIKNGGDGTKIGNLLRSIGRSDILEKAVNLVGDVASGNYLGAIKNLVSKDKDLSPEQKAEAIKLIELDYADRANAREMQIIALQQNDKFSKRFVYYFAIGIAFFSMALIFLLFFVDIPDDNKRVVDMLLGVVIGTGLISVINFFYGSSQGSKTKTELLGQNK